jgi:hypothetical protein
MYKHLLLIAYPMKTKVLNKSSQLIKKEKTYWWQLIKSQKENLMAKMIKKDEYSIIKALPFKLKIIRLLTCFQATGHCILTDLDRQLLWMGVIWNKLLKIMSNSFSSKYHKNLTNIPHFNPLQLNNNLTKIN